MGLRVATNDVFANARWLAARSGGSFVHSSDFRRRGGVTMTAFPGDTIFRDAALSPPLFQQQIVQLVQSGIETGRVLRDVPVLPATGGI